MHAMETDDLHGFRLALQGIVKASSLAQKASTTHRNNVLSSNAFAAIGSTANDDEEASTQSPRKLNLLPKATLTACVNIICIALGNTGLLKVLLEFWNEPDHGCWTLLLSAGPVSSDENSGHYCVLLHDLVRRSAPVSSPPSGHHLNAASIIEIVGLVVKTRPCSLFDHNQEGHSPLYAALYHKAPSLVAVSVAPLTHIPHDVSSPLFRRAKVLQEQVLLIAMEKESEWDLPPKYLTDLVLRDLMGQIEKSYEVEQNLQWDELVSGKRQGNESKVDQMLREQSEATRVKETRPPQSNLHELLGLSERQILPSPTSSPMLRSSGGSGGLPFAVPLPSLQQTSQPSIPSLAHIPPPAPYNPFAKRAPPIK